MKTLFLFLLVLPFSVRADDENYYRTHWSYEVYKETETTLTCDKSIQMGTPYHNKAQPEPENLKLPMKSVNCYFNLAVEDEKTGMVSRTFECFDSSSKKRVAEATIRCNKERKQDSMAVLVKGKKEAGVKVRFFCSYL